MRRRAFFGVVLGGYVLAGRRVAEDARWRAYLKRRLALPESDPEHLRRVAGAVYSSHDGQTIRNCYVADNMGAGITVTHAYCQIHDCVIENCGGWGMDLTRATSCSVHDCWLVHNGSGGVTL